MAENKRDYYEVLGVQNPPNLRLVRDLKFSLGHAMHGCTPLND